MKLIPGAALLAWLIAACGSDDPAPAPTPDTGAGLDGSAPVDAANADGPTPGDLAPSQQDLMSAADSAVSPDAPGADGLAADAGTASGDGGALVQSAACLMCTQEAITNGSEMLKKVCPPQIGCAGLADPERSRCEALLQCMLETRCWDDALGAVKCFCGTATGLACTTAPTGVCRKEFQAATGTTDNIMVSARMFDVRNHPASGLPAKLFQCQIQAGCRSTCAMY